MIKSKLVRGGVAFFAGCAVIYVADHLLGVQIELFRGLSTFSFLWFIDMFIAPFISGAVVSMIYGIGGKWLCYFPPLMVRVYSYMAFAKFGAIPEGASLLPLGWWGFSVIVVVESAVFGGVIGEVMLKKTYGRMPRHLVYKDKPKQVSSHKET